MDSTKAHSYRRWRNKFSKKNLRLSFKGDVSFKDEAVLSPFPNEKDSPVKPSAEEEKQHFLKVLKEEFKKTMFFRKEKVQEIKQRIKKGTYCISGKDIVEKWFSKESASNSS